MTTTLDPAHIAEAEDTDLPPGRPRILLLIATRSYRTADLMEAAVGLDCELTVGSDAPTALAGLQPGATVTLPLDDPAAAARAIATLHAHYPLRAVVGLDDDTVVAAATACELLHLRGNPVAAVQAARDKAHTRALLTKAGLVQPRFFLVEDGADLAQAATRAPYPCVIKPLSLGGSRGVIRADDRAAFVAAAARVRAILAVEAEAAAGQRPAPDRRLLVEGFLPGREVALEGLLSRGTLQPLALFDKPDPLDGPYFEETLYVTPSRLPESVQREIVSTTGRAVDALGLREGPIHAELRVDNTHCAVVEIAPRTIGGLCSRTLRFGAGIRLEELVLRHALGEGVERITREERPAGVMMLPIPRAGRLRAVRGQAAARRVAGVVDLTITIPRGQEVVPLPEGDRYLGFLFARGPTPAAVEESLRTAHARLRFDIEP
ncbi:MAG: ATP-grasp domain-containing protein [Nitrospirota bacterium]